ncbi:helix-turn-helix transcriptional regulator [Solirubrobacter soli]|uniref:helix-turn-helix transcriptional regulator n=1 Tax=Solirubrobacter soli TaxID=363832 RepID=UPI000426C444|nr:AAA family ATPase [Solirubrobacter soli]
MTVPDSLLERGAELDELTGLLAAARAANGSVALLEAPAGQGKTALLRVLRAQAAASGMRVLGATGAPLERDFAFGVVRQLFDAELHRADASRRAALLAGAAALAEPVFGAAVSSGEDASHSTLYGLYWLCANLAAEQPLLAVVDDAHWADAPSLRFLDALARRVEDLPVLLALGARPAEPGAEQELLDGLAVAPATRLLRPAALSADGVGELVRSRIDASPEFVEACFETTRGNPLLLTELLRAAPFAGSAEEADDVRTTVPGTLARTVSARIRRLSPGALSVARATAVLGDATSVRRVGALSGLGTAAAAAELEVLARADLIDAAEGRFIHPMVLEIVDADLGAERPGLHRRAARLLAEDGAHDGVVAAHLLAAEPEPDPWAAGVLAAAGRRALAEGAPDVALRLLQRASPTDPGILLSLGLAQFRTGVDPLPALDEAAATGSPEIAAEATRLAATALLLRGEPRAAVARLRATLESAPPELAGELEEQLVEAFLYSDEDAEESVALLARIEATAGSAADASAVRPTLQLHLAHARALAGARKEDVVPLTRRALENAGVIARLGVERFATLWGIESLLAVEAAPEALAAIRAMSELTNRSGSRTSAGAAAWLEARWERRFGSLRRSEDLARLSLELGGDQPIAITAASGTLAATLLDRGDVAGAREIVDGLPDQAAAGAIIGLYAITARVLLAEKRPLEALEQLDLQLAVDTARNWTIGIREDDHLLRVQVLAALGRSVEAREAADREIAAARARGARGAEAIAHLARAALELDPVPRSGRTAPTADPLPHSGRAAPTADPVPRSGRTAPTADPLPHLEAAVAAARDAALPLVLATALADYGAALRRAGRRTDAREPLREARDRAHRCGATALEARVHDELVVAGARPQRLAFSGVDALTASERRVAELAVRGLRNREIAEALFVSLKTVEVHLGRTYTKLGIKGRSQLPEALET